MTALLLRPFQILIDWLNAGTRSPDYDEWQQPFPSYSSPDTRHMYPHVPKGHVLNPRAAFSNSLPTLYQTGVPPAGPIGGWVPGGGLPAPQVPLPRPVALHAQPQSVYTATAPNRPH